MDIKKIESNKNDFILFLDEKELQLIDRILVERIVRAAKGDDYNTQLHEYTEGEIHIAETLRDDICDGLYQ